MDVALTVMDAKTSNKSGNKNIAPGSAPSSDMVELTWTDMEPIVRLLVQWQGEINRLVTVGDMSTLGQETDQGKGDGDANVGWRMDDKTDEEEDDQVRESREIPTFLLTLQSTLLIPQKNEDQLVHFLLSSASDEDYKEETTTTTIRTATVPRDALVQRVLQRIDKTTEWLTRMLLVVADNNNNDDDKNNNNNKSVLRTTTPPPNPQGMVRQWMEHQIQQELLLQTSPLVSSRATAPTVAQSPLVQHVNAALHPALAGDVGVAYPEQGPKVVL